MGGGKSSGGGSSTVQMTPEQQQQLQAQTNFETGTLFPTYQNTLSGAQTALNQSTQPTLNAANTAMGVNSANTGINEAAGLSSLATGTSGLSSLFGPQYEQQQVQGALEPAMEAAREANLANTTSYGGAGESGSARDALAEANLNSLNTQRMGNVAATTEAGVEQNQLQAGQSLLGAGQTELGNAQNAAGTNVSLAQTPQDIYNKYASVVFGMPTSSTNPNFSGTQGTTTSNNSSGKGFNLS
jgi:hypothetical protein